MSTRHRLGAIIGAGVLAASLAACSGGTPGAAAVVDGRAISEGDVDSVVTELQPVLTDQLVRGSVILTLANEPTLTEVAAEYGIAYTDSQLQDGYATAAEQAGVTPVELSDSALSFTRFQTIATALSDLSSDDQAALVTEYTDATAALDLDFNPRYGEEVSAGTYAPTSYPWIVQTGTAAS